RPRPRGAADPPRLRRKEPAHVARRAHSGAARRGRRDRPCPADRERRGEPLMADIHVMRDDLLPPRPAARRHLISIADVTRDDVARLLAAARSSEPSLAREENKLPPLRGRAIVN